MRTVAAALIAFFLACSIQPEGVADITSDELTSTPPPGALILDVRSSNEFVAGHIPDAINIPHDEMAVHLAELGSDKDRPVVVYCERGVRAAKAGSILVDAGHTNVLHLAGDMREWREQQRPVVVPTTADRD